MKFGAAILMAIVSTGAVAAEPTAPVGASNVVGRSSATVARATVAELDMIEGSSVRFLVRGNVRAEPSLDAPVVAARDKDSLLPVVGRVKGSEWYAVKIGGRLAYARGTMLAVERDAPRADGEIYPIEP